MKVIILSKSFVAAHTRKNKDGTTTNIAAYYDKRVKKIAQHAPDHNHDVSHLSDVDKVKFQNMHHEQHAANHYEAHALKRKLDTEKQLLATLERSAEGHEAKGDKKSVTITHNKIIKLKVSIMRHEKMLARAELITNEIGKMKEGFVQGSSKLTDDSDKAHAHYVNKVGERFSSKPRQTMNKPTQPQQSKDKERQEMLAKFKAENDREAAEAIAKKQAKKAKELADKNAPLHPMINHRADGTFGVKIPFDLKDKFKKQFSSAKWDGTTKEWTVGKLSGQKLNTWLQDKIPHIEEKARSKANWEAKMSLMHPLTGNTYAVKDELEEKFGAVYDGKAKTMRVPKEYADVAQKMVNDAKADRSITSREKRDAHLKEIMREPTSEEQKSIDAWMEQNPADEDALMDDEFRYAVQTGGWHIKPEIKKDQPIRDWSIYSRGDD